MIKLTDADGYSRRGQVGETLWSVGATITPTGTGTAPCGPGVLHLYATLLQAQLFNPIHGAYERPRAWDVTPTGACDTDGLKWWTTAPVSVVAELPRPQPLPTLHLVAWSILVARTRPQSSQWSTWTTRWLDGSDRSQAAARVAAAVAAEGAVGAAVAAAGVAAGAEWAAVAASVAAGARAATAEMAAAAEWAARGARGTTSPAYPDWDALWAEAARYV